MYIDLGFTIVKKCTFHYEVAWFRTFGGLFRARQDGMWNWKRHYTFRVWCSIYLFYYIWLQLKNIYISFLLIKHWWRKNDLNLFLNENIAWVMEYERAEGIFKYLRLGWAGSHGTYSRFYSWGGGRGEEKFGWPPSPPSFGYPLKSERSAAKLLLYKNIWSCHIKVSPA